MSVNRSSAADTNPGLASRVEKKQRKPVPSVYDECFAKYQEEEAAYLRNVKNGMIGHEARISLLEWQADMVMSPDFNARDTQAYRTQQDIQRAREAAQNLSAPWIKKQSKKVLDDALPPTIGTSASNIRELQEPTPSFIRT
ncbi:hypothetical protein HDU93_005349 [Gonapodya sp. JEL0774]|nr:hypothetical protein HDU93_005349 [Gonapodya sp. JEL0774]